MSGKCIIHALPVLLTGKHRNTYPVASSIFFRYNITSCLSCVFTFCVTLAMQRLLVFLAKSLPFGDVKDSGFGRFDGVKGLRACCLVDSVVDDRF